MTERITELRANEFTIVCCNPDFREVIRKTGFSELINPNPKVKMGKVNFYTATAQQEPWRVFSGQPEFRDHLKLIAASVKVISLGVN